MAFATITFKHPVSGAIKEAPVGFSWTSFFFGLFPALIRGDFKWALIMLLLFFPTFGLSPLVFCFIYNKLYIKDLIGKGFKAHSVTDSDIDSLSAKIGMQIPALNVA